MADNTILNSGSGGDTISTDDLGTVKVQRVKVQFGVDGSATDVSASNPLPITNGLVQALTDTQLRATAVPVSNASLPLPTGASTSAKQDSLLTELQLKADLTETQPVSLATNTPDVTDRAARLLGVVSIQKQATYRASTIAVLIPAVTSPNPFFVIEGSASKTIKVQSIIVSGITLTAVAYINIGLRKYSTAASGGTSTTLTNVPLDSTSAAGTATVKAYTAIPTAGTTVGDISSRRVLGQATTAAAAGIPQIVDFDFSPTGDTNSPVLRGTAQGLGLYFITAPASTISCLIRVEWTEEA